MSSLLEITQNGHVRTIRLNRPEKKNALSQEFAWGIIEAVEQAARDDETWVVAITGTDDAFCAGLDLSPENKDFSPLTDQESFLDDIGWVGRFPLVLREVCEKPVVAGVNGVAVGAGLSLAMAADMRIVAKSARLMAGYTRIGGSPDGGLSWTLGQALGYEGAMRFMLENRTVNGEEAVALGMAGEVVEDDVLAARLEDYCQALAKWSPITTRAAKRVIGKATRHPDLEAHVRLELSTIRRCFGSEDAKEARQAFFEKRAPQFKGR
ncbi:MAG: enoyl-CoA hydratase/isomerase family protein [Alphaproteobacteria bacterium]|nr:MAG: enoyl-CoA hydratase/isomerase family protein [Alphaproteobacteria bacterium]